VIWVGLTGGIASGKSTISRLLLQEGAAIIDADRISHKLIQRGGVAYQAVIDSFGVQILDECGEINRTHLGQIIFSDPEKRQRLNQIIHPLVFERAHSEKKSISRQDPEKVIVFEVPLLFEARACDQMDFILLAYIDQKTQIKRLMHRDALSRENALLRLHAQMSIESKVELSDEVIDTGVLMSELKKNVHKTYLKLKDRQEGLA